MQSYLHLYQASGARVSGAITAPQDLLKGKPVLVHSSDLGKHVVDFSVGPSPQRHGSDSGTSLPLHGRSINCGLATNGLWPGFSGGARTMVEDDHPEAVNDLGE